MFYSKAVSKPFTLAVAVLLCASRAAHAAAAEEGAPARNLRRGGVNRRLANPFNGPASQQAGGGGAGPPATIPRKDIPSVDRPSLAAEDAERHAAGLPMRFAVPHEVNISPKNSGTWDVVGGTRVWRQRVKSPGCNSMNFGFCGYSMPEGGTLHIYDKRGRSSIRTFTSLDNKKSGDLWTPILQSCDVILEVNLKSTTNIDDLNLQLCSANVGYRGFGTRPEHEHGTLDSLGNSGNRELESPHQDNRELSGACNVDVACSSSDGYPQIDNWRREIPSVATYSLKGSLTCTGAMINNVKEDKTPYFLTAHHCGIKSNNAGTMVVYWNFETSKCNVKPDGDHALYSTSGATHLVNSVDSDTTLVRLDGDPNPEWGVNFAGWDRSGKDATSAACIHHPGSDEKRISFEDDPTTTTNYDSNDINPSGDHIRVADWEVGTTEGGSSGSPLFDQKRRIIGSLHGGDAACDNDGADWYGRFSVSMDNGLAVYLDPDSVGDLTTDTLIGGNTDAPTVTVQPSVSPAPSVSPTVACASRPGNNLVVLINVKTDDYPKETSWTLTNTCIDEIVAFVAEDTDYWFSEYTYTHEVCVPASGRYDFTISDSKKDGLCCKWGNGDYTIAVDGVEIASGSGFGSSDTTPFGADACGPVTPEPTSNPTVTPTVAPTASTNPPTSAPTMATPTGTAAPSKAPTTSPTAPTASPSKPPTGSPTTPTNPPSKAPTNPPTEGTTVPVDCTTFNKSQCNTNSACDWLHLGRVKCCVEVTAPLTNICP